MKNFYLILFFLTLNMVLFTSCSKDEMNPNPRDKYLGAYFVNESCTSGNDSYNITVTESSSSENSILISKIYNISNNIINATVNESGMTILNQIVQSANVSGSGNINGNSLTITFSISADNQTDNCTTG